MSPFAYMILLNLTTGRFCIYRGDANDPLTWEFSGHSCMSMTQAEDIVCELEEASNPL